MNKTNNTLKELKGTDQKTRLDKEVNVETINVLPSAPTWFKKSSKLIYEDTGHRLILMGILNPVNMNLFIAYCRELGMYFDLEKQFNTINSKFQEGKTGTSIHPAYKMAREALGNAVKIAQEFGMTPLQMTKVTIKPQKEKDDLEQLMED